MKTFETKIKDSDMTLKVICKKEKVSYEKDGITCEEDADTISFYNDELLMERFFIQSIFINYEMTRLVAGQVFPADKKAYTLYNALLDFMYDEHKEIYDTIKFNNKFISFLKSIVKED